MPGKAVFEVYADHDDRPGRTDRTTAQLFAGIQETRYRAGLQIAHQERQVANGGSIDLDMASLFGSWKVSEKAALLGRVDRLFDPNPEGERIPYIPFDATSKATLFIAGAEWKLDPHLSLIPNVEYVDYDDSSSDIIPRVTFFFTF
jgi:hypothetical protein